MFKVSKKTKKNRNKTLEQGVYKHTRTTSGASTVNFERVSHFILLLLLFNSNK